MLDLILLMSWKKQILAKMLILSQTTKWTALQWAERKWITEQLYHIGVEEHV